jgi:biopolymer transport protein ExbD
MARYKKKKRRTSSVPIASMGDIAFLLIIFFMLLSEFSKDKNVKLALPLSEHVEKTKIQVAARVSIDEDGTIYMDGYKMANAKEIEIGVRAYLASKVTDDQRHIQFKCDKNLSKEVFEPVLQAIAEGGGIIDAVGEIE